MISSVSQSQGVVANQQEAPTLWKRITHLFKRVVSSPLFWTTLKAATLAGATITSIILPALLPVAVVAPTLGIGLAALGVEVDYIKKRRPQIYLNDHQIDTLEEYLRNLEL